MNLKIENIDNSQNDIFFKSTTTPLTYGVSIKIENDEIILTREYFYVGYSYCETIDDFYFNTDLPWRNDIGITKGTFLTKNFNPDYIKQKEEELINLFYQKLIKSENDYIKERKKLINDIDNKILKYQKYQKCKLFINIQRKEKLYKISK